jgi:hypothetical protein
MYRPFFDEKLQQLAAAIDLQKVKRMLAHTRVAHALRNYGKPKKVEMKMTNADIVGSVINKAFQRKHNLRLRAPVTASAAVKALHEFTQNVNADTVSFVSFNKLVQTAREAGVPRNSPAILDATVHAHVANLTRLINHNPSRNENLLHLRENFRLALINALNAGVKESHAEVQKARTALKRVETLIANKHAR